MTYGTKKEFREAADRGSLVVFEIEGMARINPGWITKDIEKKAYENEIRIRLMQGVGGFETAINMGSTSYYSSIECLQLAEKAVIGAKERGLGDHSQLLNEAVIEVDTYSKGSFEGTRALSEYLNRSEFNESLKQHIEARLYRNAQDYSNQFLKRANISARRIKRNIKSDMAFAKRICADLEKVRHLNKYGIKNESRINQIKQKAYENGVVFIREFSKKCSSKRACRLEKIATGNESILKNINSN
ncbi:hypothetical protein KAT36_02900 [Candidatus Pacearchaeota archaeon]|nr:hypothetical protein [Candidatus Pacearchaeota archaeon]